MRPWKRGLFRSGDEPFHFYIEENQETGKTLDSLNLLCYIRAVTFKAYGIPSRMDGNRI